MKIVNEKDSYKKSLVNASVFLSVEVMCQKECLRNMEQMTISII